MTGSRHDAQPRDPRLQLFGQGQRGDAAPGSAWLAAQASDVSRPEVLDLATDDELLGIGRAWKSLETWTFAGKLAVVRELITRYPLNDRDEPGPKAGGLPDQWDPRLYHEVAAALGISLVAAGKLVNLTWTLDARLPGIRTALDDNRLDPLQVRTIVDETGVLDDEDMFTKAEAIILAGLPGCRTWSDLARLVQRAVIMVDPDGARKRREKAEREHARIRFWRENWGTCAMQATGLPADEALAANARIEGRTRAYKAAGISHPMDILRVMAYLDLINEVTIAQRAAWAQADAAARTAEEDEQAARDAELRKARDKARGKARRNPAASPTSQDPETRDRPDGDGPHGDGPHGDGPDGDGPDGDGPDGDGPDCRGPDGGMPGGGGPAGGDGGYPCDWPADGWPVGDGGQGTTDTTRPSRPSRPSRPARPTTALTTAPAWCAAGPAAGSGCPSRRT
ncbi:MAG: hypothetical protein JWM19_5392 [Actinomycetia bacterium]|nr:hypothetical protein [Actinomycetes bacterium]